MVVVVVVVFPEGERKEGREKKLVSRDFFLCIACPAELASELADCPAPLCQITRDDGHLRDSAGESVTVVT